MTGEPLQFALKFVPFVLFLELPLYILIWLGALRYCFRRTFSVPLEAPFYPSVSCTIICYSEGSDIKKTIRSLLEQLYPAKIELNILLDGAMQNAATYQAVKEMQPFVACYANRSLRLIPKRQRGGRVSSMNAGLQFATGQIVMALDGDTSFDNDMIIKAVQHFRDDNVIALSGILQVRNAAASLVTLLQAMEYKLTVHAGKLGLAEMQSINNIPGAFGIFRKSFLHKIGGWNSGTAEDLDLTIRIKQYLGRHPNLRIAFEPEAVAHTDVPDTWKTFFQQRLRWDGDLSYIYLRKHALAFNPALMGWRNFIFILWYGVLFQVVMPFLIVFYTIYVFWTQALPVVLGALLLIYSFYFVITGIQYVLFLLMLSTRPGEDSRLLWLLPLFPAYAFVIRVWSVAANLNELFNKGHLDSSMAPWWVLKRDKF